MNFGHELLAIAHAHGREDYKYSLHRQAALVTMSLPFSPVLWMLAPDCLNGNENYSWKRLHQVSVKTSNTAVSIDYFSYAPMLICLAGSSVEFQIMSMAHLCWSQPMTTLQSNGVNSPQWSRCFFVELPSSEKAVFVGFLQVHPWHLN